MNIYKLLAFVSLVYSSVGWTQCAPGIPDAGNPGCIPPTAPGSPYGQPDSAGDSPTFPPPAPIWEDRWAQLRSTTTMAQQVAQIEAKQRATPRSWRLSDAYTPEAFTAKSPFHSLISAQQSLKNPEGDYSTPPPQPTLPPTKPQRVQLRNAATPLRARLCQVFVVTPFACARDTVQS